MKRRFFILGLILLTSVQMMLAQSMTDAQIVDYAKQRGATGANPKTIGVELLAKGATVEQLKRVYNDYNSALDDDNEPSGATVVNRDRINNGEAAPAATTSSGGRRVFGRDIFRSKNLSFEPNMNTVVPQNYVLGPGDELIVDIYGASQTSAKYTIAPDGSVVIPRIGPVAVSGMSVEGAQARIMSTMGKHYTNSSIKLTVGQTRTISISVMGEVLTPGTYTLSAFATVFHALYMAGGTSSIGTLRDIKVARNGHIISTVDVYEYILNGRLAGNVALADNDVIIVGAYNNLVEITGNVKRPMWYEMKRNESVKSILSFAGEFTGDAFTKSISVERRAGDKLSVYNVDEFDFGSFTLADEDHVIVRGNEQRYSNLTVINGAVKRPGNYELSSVSSVKGLIDAAGGLEEEALRTRAVLTRLNEDRTRRTITIDLAGIIAGTAADVILQNEDVLTIGSLATLHGEQTFTIEGEVFYPGTMPFADNTTIEDLITKAGGLRESASLLNVEVARRIVDPSAPTDLDIRSETFNFTLKDDLTIEGGTGFVLKPYDHVYIRRSPVYNAQRTVKISGEVMFAGNYVLADQNVRISEIVNRAGGLKKKASAHDARLLRAMDGSEHARQNQMLKMAENAADSVDIAHLELASTYSVGIDLEKALKNPGSDYDVVLRDGDQIIIPQLNTTVKINGEVLYPNSVTFKEGKGYQYYINEAGGFTKESVKRKSYIIYANGHVSKASKGHIESGCEIVVPTKKHKHDATDTMKWVSLSSSIITAAALVMSVLK